MEPAEPLVQQIDDFLTLSSGAQALSPESLSIESAAAGQGPLTSMMFRQRRILPLSSSRSPQHS